MNCASDRNKNQGEPLWDDRLIWLIDFAAPLAALIATALFTLAAIAASAPKGGAV